MSHSCRATRRLWLTMEVIDNYFHGWLSVLYSRMFPYINRLIVALWWRGLMRLSIAVPTPGALALPKRKPGLKHCLAGGILKIGAPVPGTIAGGLAGYNWPARPPGCCTEMYPGLLPHGYQCLMSQEFIRDFCFKSESIHCLKVATIHNSQVLTPKN